MQGWVSIHRKIMNNPVWQDPKLLKLWMLCLLEASHKEHEQLIGKQIINLQPGQFVTGRFSLSKTYNDGAKKVNRVEERTLWRWLKMLETYEFLSIKSNTKYSVVTIKNWNLYQQNVQPMSNQCPANVQPVSTNNNGNKGNNEKKKDTTTTTENPIALFEKSLCRLSTNQSHSLYQWVDDFGGNQEIVNEAIRIADNKNKRYFGFVEYLLKEWSNNKLDSLDRVKVYEQEKFNKTKRTGSTYAKKPVRQEQTPEWFDEDSNKPKKEQAEDPEVLEAKKQEITEKLKQFRGG